MTLVMWLLSRRFGALSDRIGPRLLMGARADRRGDRPDLDGPAERRRELLDRPAARRARVRPRPVGDGRAAHQHGARVGAAAQRGRGERGQQPDRARGGAAGDRRRRRGRGRRVRARSRASGTSTRCPAGRPRSSTRRWRPTAPASASAAGWSSSAGWSRSSASSTRRGRAGSRAGAASRHRPSPSASPGDPSATSPACPGACAHSRLTWRAAAWVTASRSRCTGGSLLRAYQWVAYAALVTLVLIVLSGAGVRLTGSGLGCPSWPDCEGTFLPELPRTCGSSTATGCSRRSSGSRASPPACWPSGCGRGGATCCGPRRCSRAAWSPRACSAGSPSRCTSRGRWSSPTTCSR